MQIQNEILLKEEMDRLTNMLMNYSINYIMTGKKDETIINDIKNLFNDIEYYVDFTTVSENILDKLNNIKIVMNIFGIQNVDFKPISNEFESIKDQGVIKLLQKSIFNS